MFFGAAFLFILSSVTRIAVALEENTEFVGVEGGSYFEGVVGQPTALNPLISTNPVDEDINKLIYSNLLDLLSDYEVSENGKVYALKLKTDLKWSDNGPLTSDDVIFTLKTIQDPETRSPLAPNWRGVIVERVSELQIKLTLPVLYSFFTRNVSELLIVPKHVFGGIPSSNLRLSKYNLEPISSGPYRFKNVSIRKDGFITEYELAINENYAGKKPFIKDFNFKFFGSEKDLLQAFALRKINGFGNLSPFDSEKYESQNVVVHKVPMPRYYAIFINQNVNPALKNKELRYALDIAIDKFALLEVVRDLPQIIESPLFGRDGNPAESENNYNFEEAKKIFESTNVKLELNLIVPQIDFLVRSAEFVKDAWLKAGADKVNIIALNPEDLSSNVIKSRNYETLLFGNALEVPSDLFPFWHSSGRFYPGLNLSLYENSKADTFFEKVRQTENENERESFAGEAARLIKEGGAAIFLYTLPYTYIHTKNLEGFSLKDGFLSSPNDRFENVEDWSILRVRVFK